MVRGCACSWVLVLGCWIFGLLCPIADLHLPYPSALLELDFWLSTDPAAGFPPIFIVIFIYVGFLPIFIFICAPSPIFIFICARFPLIQLTNPRRVLCCVGNFLFCLWLVILFGLDWGKRLRIWVGGFFFVLWTGGGGGGGCLCYIGVFSSTARML